MGGGGGQFVCWEEEDCGVSTGFEKERYEHCFYFYCMKGHDVTVPPGQERLR